MQIKLLHCNFENTVFSKQVNFLRGKAVVEEQWAGSALCSVHQTRRKTDVWPMGAGLAEAVTFMGCVVRISHIEAFLFYF